MIEFYAYQWDTKYTVSVPWDEDSVPYMDFVRRWSDNSRGTVTPTLADGTLTAICPPELLTAPGSITVWLRDENTRQQAATLIVQPRSKPDDYVYTESERWTAEKAVTEAIEKALATGDFTGPKGDKGDPGPAGHTPVKGVDYFTENDKKELTAGLSQIEAPEIVASVAEMTDASKHYVLGGNIYYNKEVVIPGETTRIYPNQFVPGNATLNVRMSGSSGSTSARNGYFVTDFIEVKNFTSVSPYTARLNWEMISTNTVGTDDSKVLYYNSAKSKIGHNFLLSTENVTASGGETVFDLKNFIATGGGSAPTVSDVSYVRLQLSISTSLAALTSADIANLKITFDAVYEETTTESTTVQEWVDSGISYAPAFKTDLVGVLGEGNVIYLSDNLPSGTYTLKYGDETYDTIGTITVV